MKICEQQTFWVILLTDRQTDRQTNKSENITYFFGGGKIIMIITLHLLAQVQVI